MQLRPISELKRSEESANESAFFWRLSALHAARLFMGTLSNNCLADCVMLRQMNLTYSHRFGQELAAILEKYVYQNGFHGDKDACFFIECIQVHDAESSAGNNTNIAQARAVAKIVRELETEDFAILTPYRNQVEAIGRICAPYHLEDSLMTIHKSQGREWETVILSLVDDYPRHFTDTVDKNGEGIHLINTAISRARKKLIIVGDAGKWAKYPKQMICELMTQPLREVGSTNRLS